jgi:arabinose-5-phosphate isomerase
LNTFFNKAEEGLSSLRKNVPASLGALLENIRDFDGNVIASGVGKSSFIAQKFAASLASIGIKSFFVHPTEANHGNLGGIQKDDLILLFSNSGESKELFPMAIYAQKSGIPCYVMTSDVHSQLASLANPLLIPEIEEYDPLGIVPTTSSLLMLLLSDCIVAALAEEKRPPSTHFQKWHPAGRIGEKLQTAKDVMESDYLPLVSSEALVSDALHCFARCRSHVLGVLDGSRFTGFLTYEQLSPNLPLDTPVASLPLRSHAVEKKTPLTEIKKLFASHKCREFFVLDEEGQVVGMVRETSRSH